MGIVNIRDYRDNSVAFNKVDVVVEPTWHDNFVDGADRINDTPQMRKVAASLGGCGGLIWYKSQVFSVAEAIAWANETFPFPVTLFIYDHGTHPKDLNDDLQISRPPAYYYNNRHRINAKYED